MPKKKVKKVESDIGELNITTKSKKCPVSKKKKLLLSNMVSSRKKLLSLVLIVASVFIFCIVVTAYYLGGYYTTLYSFKFAHGNPDYVGERFDACLDNTNQVLEDRELLLAEIDEKHLGVYYGSEATLILFDNGIATIELLNIDEGEVIITGIYGLSNDKLVIFMQPFQYHGLSGDFKSRREFKVLLDGVLEYVDEYKDTQADIINHGDLFTK
jgi:hypothetical protein